MVQTIYIKAPQCIEIQHRDIVLGDVITVYTSDYHIRQQIQSIPLYTFSQKKKTQIIISFLKIIEILKEEFANIEIQNIGEEDIILIYTPFDKHRKMKEYISTIFICLVAFFGGGYAIMAYNTDAGAKELFTYLSMLFLGNATTGVTCLVITYSIGLTIGMILFFNHLGNKKLSSDPTPLEVQMRLYENDLCTTIIKNADRDHKTLDIHS